MRRIALALLIALGGAAGAAPARADAKKARVAFDKGNKLYNLGRFEEALKSFEQAYLEKEDPVFLFNIGQCHRQAGHTAEALRAYRSYLRVAPEAPNRGEVERRIQDLEAASQARPAEVPPAPPPSPAPLPTGPASTPSTAPTLVTAAPAPAPSEAPHPFYTRVWFWGAVGVVVVGAVVAGVVLGSKPAEPACPLGLKCF